VKKEDHDDDDPGHAGLDGVVVSPTTVPDSKPITFRFEDPVSSIGFVTIDQKRVKPEQEDDDGVALARVPTVAAARSKILRYRFEHHKPPISSLDCLEGRYYTHFVDEVATLLLIYDNSMNTNPYRRCFPDLSRSSPSMASAMEALGALHLANTANGPQRNAHFQHAMGKYGEVVKLFRTRYKEADQSLRLTDFATCLLLALFEVCFLGLARSGPRVDSNR
jgi:hypothetical protein